jgi:alcohol dehydrogenase (cytochrome c)
VFYGDPEGYFWAVDDETGEALWNFQVGSGIHGNPTTFTAGDKQYVAIVWGAGGGGIWPIYYGDFLKKASKGGGVMVFAVE